MWIVKLPESPLVYLNVRRMERGKLFSQWWLGIGMTACWKQKQQHNEKAVWKGVDFDKEFYHNLPGKVTECLTNQNAEDL